MGLPEGVVAVGAQELEVGVLGLGLGEGGGPSVHDEEDDCGREQVHGGPQVGLLRMDFRRHVTFGAKTALQQAVAVSSLHQRRKPEVCDF